MLTVPDTKRLTYTLMSQDDADFLFQLDQDPEVMRHINGGKPSSRDYIEQVFLPRMKSYTKPAAGFGMWRVTESISQQSIGWILVRPMGFFTDNPQLDNLELGWRFLQSAWGKGYATEAALSVKEALIANGGLTALSAIALPANQASIKIMTKLGMCFEKQAIHKDPLGDELVVYYRLQLD